MSWGRVAVSLVIVIIFITSVFFAVRNMQSTTAATLPAPVMTPEPQAQVREPATLPPAPARTPFPAVTALPGPTPRFYRTITFGSNRSSALTEQQAWHAAEIFFSGAGITDIRAAEVVPLGQHIVTSADAGQEIVWSFQVTRTTGGIRSGGLVTIDAYDGHVIDFSGYD